MKNRSPFAGFRPSSVAEQAAELLREAIGRGAWSWRLPSEYELSRRMGISRTSVHNAVMLLAREGWVKTGEGRPAAVNARRRRRPEKRARVCLIAPVPREAIVPAEHAPLLQVHSQLADRGVQWEEIFDATLGGSRPETRLRDLAAGREGVCWLLLSSTAAMQRWFERSRMRALVFGSCHPGISLPSVDIDFRAVGWHAAGCLVRRGHGDVIFLLPPRPFPGDLACRDGFLGYLAQSRRSASAAEILLNLSAPRPWSKLDRLLARPRRPTAILSVGANESLAVLIHLLRSGFAVPQAVSVISCQTHAALEEAATGLARYRLSPERLARKVVRLTQVLLAGRPIAPRPHLIIPTFHEGTSLAGASLSAIGPPA